MMHRSKEGIYRSTNENAEIFGNACQAMKHPYYERMDIVLVDFGKDYGKCVMGNFRPAIVVSRTSYNMSSPVMQVIPLTKQLKAVDKEYHVFIDRNDCEGFEASGLCLVEQMATVDRRQVRRKIAMVTAPGLIEKIGSAILCHLGLRKEEN